jgi:hypothetical protein
MISAWSGEEPTSQRSWPGQYLASNLTRLIDFRFHSIVVLAITNCTPCRIGEQFKIPPALAEMGKLSGLGVDRSEFRFFRAAAEAKSCLQ